RRTRNPSCAKRANWRSGGCTRISRPMLPTLSKVVRDGMLLAYRGRMVWSRLVIAGVLVVGCTGADDSDTSPFDSAASTTTGTTGASGDPTASPTSAMGGTGSSSSSGPSSDGVDADTGVKFDLENPDAPDSGGLGMGC